MIIRILYVYDLLYKLWQNQIKEMSGFPSSFTVQPSHVSVISDDVLASKIKVQLLADFNQDEDEQDELNNYLSYQDGSSDGSSMRYSMSVLISLLTGSVFLILVTFLWWRYTQRRHMIRRLCGEI
eukprot:TRINITY_DN11871_c1_g1_i2.p1 TRINITY_DN11871_c1_g1~~TRINITY_DN11871_c1_g1_i2.p1  ORF type:complete len:125 (-),score=2.92 TRINITY_DN11871_c1_g1_i2:48-422(-)